MEWKKMDDERTVSALLGPGEALPALLPAGMALFEPPPEGRFLTAQDASQLLENPARWLYRTMLEAPFSITGRELTTQAVGPLVMELLVNMAVLAFRVRATRVAPVYAMHRVVLVNYTPWSASDPPVPLLSLLDLPRRAEAMHNEAIHLLLKDGDTSALRPAMGLVLRGGAERGMHVAEAFFYVTKMLSLVTGMYGTQNQGLRVED